MFPNALLWLATWILVVFTLCESLNKYGRNVKSIKITRTKTVRVTTYTACGPFKWLRCSKTRNRNYVVNDYVYKCYPGWTSLDGQNCDHAQCFDFPLGTCANNGKCSAPGICRCASGFQSQKCTEDYDECSVANGACQQKCINSVGSYLCDCNEGYGLHSDGLSCRRICFGQPPGTCLNGGKCINTDVCRCLPGFDKQKGCTDIDECEVGNAGCNQTCVNTPGSYNCDCQDGYILAIDTKSCLPVCQDFPAGKCPNGGSCIRPDTCECLPGFNGTRCQDIDECEMSNGGCYHKCVNIHGSYRCECNDGYGLAEGNSTCYPVCYDLDPGQCPNGGQCIQPDVCSCLQGFIGQQCEDINECLVTNGGCAQDCENTLGSYKCDCKPGYALASDNTTCRDIDECNERNGGCEHECTNTIGSFNCSCDEGFGLASNHLDCDDVNECLDEQVGCQYECVNIPGSFTCACPNGYKLLADLISCNDVDECASNNGGCSLSCVNTEGSFSCQCEAGYMLAEDKKTCEDINECLQNEGNCTDLCVNIPGSFKCDCFAGYVIDAESNKCKDVNECDTDNGRCAELCENTIGSRICSCSDEFVLANDGFSCDDASKCPFNGNINCWSTCNPAPDDGCSCPLNTILHTDGQHCTDPCYSSPCLNQGKCSLTATDWQCNCENTGYKGEICQEGVVDLPEEISVRAGVLSDPHILNVRPKRQLFIHATTDNQTQVFPNPIIVTNPTTEAPFQILSTERGLRSIFWNVTGPDAVNYKNIPPLQVKTEDVFTRLGLIGDVPPKGCFAKNVTSDLVLSSTQPWYRIGTNDKQHFTKGVVFLKREHSDLALSVDGLESHLMSNKIIVGPISPNRQIEGVPDGGSSDCDEIPLSDQDHKDMTKSGSALRSLENELEKVLPQWLSLKVSQPFTNPSQLVTKILLGRDIQRIPSCSGAPLYDDIQYYVSNLKTSVVLKLMGDTVTLPIGADSLSQFCLILGIRDESLFVIMFPSEISELLQNVAIFKTLKQNNILVVPRGIGISSNQGLASKTQIPELTFWNGNEQFSYRPPAKSSVWLNARVQMTSTHDKSTSFKADGNFLFFVPDNQKIWTHVLANPWEVVLHTQFDFKMSKKFSIHGIKASAEFAIDRLDALASFGGQSGRQYCGPNALPPGVFLSAGISSRLDLDTFGLNLLEIKAEGYYFRILDSTEPPSTNEFPPFLKGNLLQFLNRISNVSTLVSSELEFLSQNNAPLTKSQQWSKTKLELMGNRLDSMTNLAKNFLSGTKVTSQSIANVILGLNKDSAEFSAIVSNISRKQSLMFDNTINLSRYLTLVTKLQETIDKLQTVFKEGINTIINGRGSWGVQAYIRIAILDYYLLIKGELVLADQITGRCDTYNEIYEDFEGDETARIYGYVETDGKVILNLAESVWAKIIRSANIKVPVGAAISYTCSQSNSKFVAELSTIVELLGIKATTTTVVTNRGLAFTIQGSVWGTLEAKLSVFADILGSNRGLRVKGSFSPGGSSLMQMVKQAIQKEARRVGDLALNRLKEAKQFAEDTKAEFIAAQEWLEDQKAVLDDANGAFDAAVNGLNLANENLEAAKAPFEAASKTLNEAQKRIDQLCQIKSCDSICIPGLKLGSCTVDLWIIKFNVPCVKSSGCMFRIPDPVCLTKNAACAAVRAGVYVILEAAKYAAAIPIRAFDLAKAAVSVTIVVVDKARVAVDIAKVAVDLAILSLEGLKIAADAAIAGIELVKEGVKLGIQLLDFITEGVANIADVRKCGFDLQLSNDVTAFDVYCDINIFSSGWNEITFTVDFGNVIGSLWSAAKAIVDEALELIPNVLGRRKRELEFSLFSTLHRQLKKRNSESAETFSGKANTTVFEFSNTEFWSQQCKIYQPILSFLAQGVTILRNISLEMVNHTNTIVQLSKAGAYDMFNSTPNLTLENAEVDLDIAREDFNLTREDLAKAVNGTNVEDDPVFRESKLASEFIHRQSRDSISSILNFRVVPIWKGKMENVSKQIFTGDQCASFYDCVIWAFGEIYQLLNSVDSQLVYAAKVSLPDLEQGYYELLSNETRGVVDVKNVSELMLQALDLIDLTDIFCGTLPNITQSPENTTVVQGNNITLKCYAEAVPIPTYSWYKNGEKVGSGKDMVNLKLTNVSDSAIYSCVAGNHIGNTSSLKASVSVVFPPKVTELLSKQAQVLIDDNVTMTCKSTGIPQPLVEWHTSSTATTPNSSTDYDEQMSIQATTYGHSGIYMCKAINAYGSDDSDEVVLHVFQGTPACPKLTVNVGFWTKPGDVPETILHKAGIQPQNRDGGISKALKVLAKDIDDDLEFVTDIADGSFMRVTVLINCKSIPRCTKLNCLQKHKELVEKLERGWGKVQDKLEQPLLAIDDQIYFLNPAVQDVPIITDTCQAGYRQFQDNIYACVEENGGYMLPVPVINDLETSNAITVSWQSSPELDIFVKGYTVVLMRVHDSDILLNVTTNQTRYELPFSSTDDISGYEIWIRVFTSSLTSAWTKRPLTDMSSTDRDTDAAARMDLVLGLSIGVTSAVVLAAVVVVLIYAMRSRNLKPYFLRRKLKEMETPSLTETEKSDPVELTIDQSDPVQLATDLSDPVQLATDQSDPVQLATDQSDPVQLATDQSERHTHVDLQDKI